MCLSFFFSFLFLLVLLFIHTFVLHNQNHFTVVKTVNDDVGTFLKWTFFSTSKLCRKKKTFATQWAQFESRLTWELPKNPNSAPELHCSEMRHCESHRTMLTFRLWWVNKLYFRWPLTCVTPVGVHSWEFWKHTKEDPWSRERMRQNPTRCSVASLFCIVWNQKTDFFLRSVWSSTPTCGFVHSSSLLQIHC